MTVTRRIRLGRIAIDLAEVGPRASSGPQPEEGGDPCYLLAVPLTGPLRFGQDGRRGTAAAGEYVLLNPSSFHELSAQRGDRILVLRLPVPDIRARMVSVEDHIARRFEPNRAMTRVLVDLLRGLIDVFADQNPPNPEALATEIVSFVALTLGAENRGAAVDVRNARYHLRRRIFDFIEGNLGDQDLSPKRIAASSRISMSYLYSLFNDDGTTVGQFLMTKRLQRAYEILVADPRGHRTVSEVAYEVGFKNVSHFSRSFSRHFRIAPRDIRHAARPEAPALHRPRPVTASGSATAGSTAG